MNAQSAIRSTMNMSSMVLKKYIEDLSDADLLRRPADGCNHLAWQLGHLISSESGLVNGVMPGKGGELPAGFAEAHSKDARGVDDPAKFLSKAKYLELYDKVHAATEAALATVSDADFDLPSPERMRSHFPTMGDYWTLIATHGMMHAGQFAVVRRQLGKPIVI